MGDEQWCQAVQTAAQSYLNGTSGEWLDCLARLIVGQTRQDRWDGGLTSVFFGLEGEFFYQAEVGAVLDDFFYGEGLVVLGDDEAVAAPVQLLVLADGQRNFLFTRQAGALALEFQWVRGDILLPMEVLLNRLLGVFVGLAQQNLVINKLALDRRDPQRILVVGQLFQLS